MRIIKQNLKLNKEQFSKLKNLTKHSNSLYNCSLYVCKQYYKATGKYIGLSLLDKEMQSNIHYKEIPSFNAQQIIRLVDKNYRSFFSLLKKKLSGQYSSDASEPKFRKSGDMFILIFDNTRVYIKNGILKLYKDLKLPFSYSINNIKQTIIKWNGSNFQIFITYQNENEELKFDNNNYLSIDFGLNNLATCVSNVGKAFIINGKPLKSYNQFYNKQKAKIQSELKIKNKSHWSNKLSKINNNRNSFVDNYLSQSVAYIVNFCNTSNINTIVLGYNEGWKQDTNIGKINNQKFTNIPYYLFRQKLESKCELLGINLILTEESYTSKTSFIDNECPVKQNKYLGNRIKRGLFQTLNKIKVNADANAAAQILIKVFPNLDQKSRKEIEVFIVSPEVISMKSLLN